MSAFTLSLILVGIYAALTFWLSIKGMKKTTSLKSFAIGKGDMSPGLVGITMASSIASTATFVINPGFVYQDGLAAYAHYGLGAMAGLATALIVLSKGFHKIGTEVQAVTLPDWIKKRYESAPLGMAFAFLTLLYITFIVLILAGSAFIAAQLFSISYHWALVVILLFVFSYVLMGGTYAHAYTNAFQGALMIVIALGVLVAGAKYVGMDVSGKLDAISPHFLSFTNPESALYHDFFSVFVSSFVVTAALMLQPHILTKVLYINSSKDMGKFLAVSIGVSVVFSFMLLIGFYARLEGMVASAQDKVVIEYIAQMAHPLVVSFVLVTLLAAGMSTLDGILVSISTVVVSDIVLAIFAKDAGEKQDGMMDRGLKLSRYVLVAVGLVSLALAWDPPKLLGLFAQQGVYGLVAASAAPLLVGILVPSYKNAKVVGTLAALGVATHFVLKGAFDVSKERESSSAWALAWSSPSSRVRRSRRTARASRRCEARPGPRHECRSRSSRLRPSETKRARHGARSFRLSLRSRSGRLGPHLDAGQARPEVRIRFFTEEVVVDLPVVDRFAGEREVGLLRFLEEPIEHTSVLHLLPRSGWLFRCAGQRAETTHFDTIGAVSAGCSPTSEMASQQAFCRENWLIFGALYCVQGVIFSRCVNFAAQWQRPPGDAISRGS